MLARTNLLTLWTALTLAVPHVAAAQTRLSLEQAIARASRDATEVRASAAAEREALARLEQARAGFRPTADVTESWQRGTQPVFVFSSLLAQRRFENFAVPTDPISRPTAVSDYRTAVTVDVPIFDATTRASMRSARIGVEMAAVRREAAQHDLTVSVVAAYGAVVNAVAMRRVVAASLDSARADLLLAEQRCDQGLVTEADVLLLRLHVAATREREIRTIADETVARAHLNQVMGAGLDEMFVVDDLMEPMAPPSDDANGEAAAERTRPEARLAALNESLADATRETARAAFLPRLAVMGSWEANGGQWDARAGSWTVGIVARLNLFRGLADRARLGEATELQVRRRIERESVEIAVRVDVRETRARLDAAKAGADVADAAVTHAVESRRIVRDRYEGGLSDVNALLRAAEGVQAAEARRITARVELIVATAAWRRAIGE